MTQAPPSPCISICTIDKASGWCEGCGRSIAEITEWASASPQRQQQIVDDLPARMTELRRTSEKKSAG
ncbi:DUF1289 domain-containing protein [Alterisphingorhabdus coralli]|uniref:DUF1289 domain-containing protein n=1 Tax=Alterisphingorhabdus coralli TaxID=3071408 RepID=A0AA97F8X9_9SPHN|nr:DUF1289 domain-containing protein [Parasphingorhabdus sp. SCSIO 66989]WOE75696.1 DUF1289 domain-containing protein [Parasphingorhabdus sp. SCSIO 66989]